MQTSPLSNYRVTQYTGARHLPPPKLYPFQRMRHAHEPPASNSVFQAVCIAEDCTETYSTLLHSIIPTTIHDTPTSSTPSGMYIYHDAGHTTHKTRTTLTSMAPTATPALATATTTATRQPWQRRRQLPPELAPAISNSGNVATTISHDLA